MTQKNQPMFKMAPYVGLHLRLFLPDSLEKEPDDAKIKHR